MSDSPRIIQRPLSPSISARRRLLAVLLTAGMVVAACSSDGDGVTAIESGATSSTTGTDGGDGSDGTPDTVTEEPSGTSAPGAPDASRPASGSGTAPTTTTESTVAASAIPGPGAVGAYATLYLRPDESQSLTLEVLAQAGAEPRQATLDHLRSVLASVSGKSVTVAGGGLGGGGKTWTSADIRALADANGADQSRAASVLKLYFLLGEFAESDSVVGVAVRSDVAVVFADKVDEAAGVLGSPAAIEDAVAMHEVGHILGLVDLVRSTGRADPEHPGHSPSRDSVMYYAVESTLIGSLLEGGPPRDFDQDDLADLAAIRNG